MCSPFMHKIRLEWCIMKDIKDKFMINNSIKDNSNKEVNSTKEDNSNKEDNSREDNSREDNSNKNNHIKNRLGNNNSNLKKIKKKSINQNKTSKIIPEEIPSENLKNLRKTVKKSNRSLIIVKTLQNTSTNPNLFHPKFKIFKFQDSSISNRFSKTRSINSVSRQQITV